MASYIQGYDEERFVTTINRNFLCLICFNVLKDPVLCPRNQHCFCRGCITKHLENSQRCPTCADELTEETLTEPPRMVKDYLNESKIRCVYHDRGCEEIVQLQHLDQHEDSCGFTPAVCTNPGCGATLNKRDLVHHQSEVCEFRKVKCHSCEEMTKTLTNLEKKMNKISEDMKEKFEIVSNEVKGLKRSFVEAFDQMKDVLIQRKDAPSGDRENIIVAGGVRNDSVEMFNWRQRTWSPLQSMAKKRYGATSFVYNNQVVIAGGFHSGRGYLDDMIRMSVDPHPLPYEVSEMASVRWEDNVVVIGGVDKRGKELNTVIMYNVKTEQSHMLPPIKCKRRGCTAVVVGNNIVVLGGLGERFEELKSVESFNFERNTWQELPEMSQERWLHTAVVV